MRIRRPRHWKHFKREPVKGDDEKMITLTGKAYLAESQSARLHFTNEMRLRSKGFMWMIPKGK